MGKSKKGESSKVAKAPKAPKAPAATKADPAGFDPTLAALFASSSGPVTIPQKFPATTKASSSKPVADTDGVLRTEADVDVNSEAGSDTTVSSSTESSTEDEHEHEHEHEPNNERPRKRRRVDVNDDLESRYLDKLAKEEEQELKQRTKQGTINAEDEDQEDSEASDSDLNSDLQDISDSDAEPGESAEEDVDEEGADNTVPQHESLDASAHDVEAEKTSRSVFLGNVSTACIKSKSAKKALIQHLQTAISQKHHEKIESIRFRSTAFVADAGPKRAAYAKKELMDETMQSTNAYVVLSSPAAARKVAASLNGTLLLGRHLRADYLGSPAKVDHRRCVFVGNLSFVDEATAPESDGPGDGSKKRKRANAPADVEEGLWRTFGKVGQVESVRVIRDKETRISKGFAYVQFTDENAVESALLMDGKKFPPMLPRLLRVSRAKKEMKRDKKAKMSKGSAAGKNTPAARGDRLGQRKGPRRSANGTAAGGERVVFEGNRATSSSLPRGLKKLKKRPSVKPTNRSSKRAAAFRAGGGKKKRDMAS